MKRCGIRVPKVRMGQLKNSIISLKPLPGDGLKLKSLKQGLRININRYKGNYAVRAAIKRCGISE